MTRERSCCVREILRAIRMFVSLGTLQLKMCFSLLTQSRSQYVHRFCDGVTILINHISITTMSTLMKVGARNANGSGAGRPILAQLIAPTAFMSVDMVVIEIWLIKVVTPSQK